MRHFLKLLVLAPFVDQIVELLFLFFEERFLFGRLLHEDKVPAFSFGGEGLHFDHFELQLCEILGFFEEMIKVFNNWVNYLLRLSNIFLLFRILVLGLLDCLFCLDIFRFYLRRLALEQRNLFLQLLDQSISLRDAEVQLCLLFQFFFCLILNRQLWIFQLQNDLSLLNKLLLK